MGTISLQIPVAGQPNSTEDPKVASDLTTIQTVINGNLDDTNLFAPQTPLRKVLLQTTGTLNALPQNVFYFVGGTAVTMGSNGSGPPDLWFADSGLSSQPQDFQVANKTAYARVRATAITNAVGPGVTIGCGLYSITSVAGASGTLAVSGSVVTNSNFNFATLNPNFVYGGESAQFALPTSSGAYFLAAFTNGAMAANSNVGVTIQLLLYHG